MSLRQVLTIYNAERQLTDDETALLNTLRRMNDNERQMLVEGLSGKAGAGKKASKKLSKSAGKSARASSLQQQIQGRARIKVDESDDDNRFDGRSAQDARDDFLNNGGDSVGCGHEFPNGGTCKRDADHNIHHLATDSLYHEFQPAEQAASASGGD